MSPPPRIRRSPDNARPVPAFFLYGEPLQPPDERLIHVETIAARSRLHDWHIRPHRHADLHQVLLVQRGRAEVTLDGATAALRAPFVILVPPGVVHAFRFQPDTVGLVTSFAIAIARDFGHATPELHDFLDRPAAQALERSMLDATDLLLLTDLLTREFARAATGRHSTLRGLLLAFLTNTMRVCHAMGSRDTAALGAGGAAASERECIARLRQLIEQRFREHWPVTRYAQELGVSEVRLRRTSLAVTGQAPIELIHLRLFVEAERQLRYTSMSITQIAYFLGFEDPAYFSRFFTRRMGIAPRTFRAAKGTQID
jgi:AraC family transcriptional activator of pobA